MGVLAIGRFVVEIVGLEGGEFAGQWWGRMRLVECWGFGNTVARCRSRC